jgi:hypothetical protein
MSKASPISVISKPPASGLLKKYRPTTSTAVMVIIKKSTAAAK